VSIKTTQGLAHIEIFSTATSAATDAIKVANGGNLYFPQGQRFVENNRAARQSGYDFLKLRNSHLPWMGEPDALSSLKNIRTKIQAKIKQSEPMRDPNNLYQAPQNSEYPSHLEEMPAV
jgi:hypothetical protein